MFSQLKTIHSYLDRVWTPGIYVLLSSKQSEAYVELLKAIAELFKTEALIKPNLIYVLSDFEVSFMKVAL